jgi:hypothetical protein
MIVKHLFYLLAAVVIGVFLLMPRVSNNKDSSLSSTTTTSNRIRLRSKNAMPLIGLGTAGIHGDAICDVLLKASQIGYRLVDSAAQVAVWYQNEKQIGDCVAANEHALSRKSLFLTTKLHPQDHGPTTSVAALKQSLANFRTDYIDLFICKQASLCFSSRCKIDFYEWTLICSSLFSLLGRCVRSRVRGDVPRQLDCIGAFHSQPNYQRLWCFEFQLAGTRTGRTILRVEQSAVDLGRAGLVRPISPSRRAASFLQAERHRVSSL